MNQLNPYSELEAAVDALSGRQPCEHGVWPHQGRCELCRVAVRDRVHSPFFDALVRSIQSEVTARQHGILKAFEDESLFAPRKP